MLAAYEYNQNKEFLRIHRRTLRDQLDPFDIPDERLASDHAFQIIITKFKPEF